MCVCVLCMCMYSHVLLHSCVWVLGHVCIIAFMWRREDNLGWPPSLSTLFETESPGSFTVSCMLQGIWPMCILGFSCLPLASYEHWDCRCFTQWAISPACKEFPIGVRHLITGRSWRSKGLGENRKRLSNQGPRGKLVGTSVEGCCDLFNRGLEYLQSRRGA